MTKGICEVDLETGKILRLFGNPEADNPSNRFNDGKCGPGGRLWVGSMGFDCGPDVALYYYLDNDGRVKKVDVGTMSIPNGLCWSEDTKTFYLIDSLNPEIPAFDFDVKTGELSNKRTCIDVPEGMGLPDGCCIDNEGKIWIAMWGGYCVARFCPETN